MAAPIDANARFERARANARQEQGAQNQEAKDAVSRRFAAMGRLNSGAALKTEQKIQAEGGSALERRLGTIQDAQDTEGIRQQEIQDARKYQTGEREASQGFSRGEREASQGFGADQARIGREYSTSERLGSQDYASMQADLQRKYGTSEREASQAYGTKERMGSQEFASGEAESGRRFANDQRIHSEYFQKQYVLKPQEAQFLKQYDLQMQQFGLDKKVTDFNMKMAESEANKKDIFAKLGDLGTMTWKGFSSLGSRGTYDYTM